MINLLEFKCGDQTITEMKLRRLIEGVSGKINGSERTLRKKIFTSTNLDTYKINFFLIVDSENVGSDSIVTTLAKLSINPKSDSQENKLFSKVLPNLKANISNISHFNEIDIWYSDFFEDYLEKYRITDMEKMLQYL